MATELTTVEKKALAKLGKEATREHRLCAKLANDAWAHANLAGAYLSQAKKSVPHGKWGDWLKEHFPEASDRTARAYMQISSRWSELSQNGNAIADLTVSGALKLLAKPKAPGPTMGEPDPLKALPPEQREGCQKDYAEECEATGEEPTAEGLRAAAELYQADNVPYDAADADPDASEPEPDETPAPTPEAAVSTPASVGHQFRIDEKARILKWVRTHGEHATMACWAENLAAAIRSEG